MLSRSIKRDLNISRALLAKMLAHIEKQFTSEQVQISSVQLWNEKDSMLSAHARIIQLQVKLVETEIKIKTEELKLKKMEKELDDFQHKHSDEADELPPLVQEEWDALFNAFERHRQEQHSKQYDDETNYAVLLK